MYKRQLTETLAKIYWVEDMDWQNFSPLACAYARARGADRMSSFGDFISRSDVCDKDTALLIKREVSDGVIAPGYTEEALEVLKQKKKGNYNVIQIDPEYVPAPLEHKQVFGVTFEQGRQELAIDNELISNIVTEDVYKRQEIELEDAFENMGAQLIKEVASKTNDVAGDGTTTATVLAQAMVHEGMKNLAAGANPIVMRRGMKKATDAAVEAIKNMSQKVSGKKQIANVASISAGDKEVGELVANAMEKVSNDGVITCLLYTSIPGPGEVSLAHRGVLFLDEMPEFARGSLEVLRQPLEDKQIQLSRARGTYVFPAGFILVAAMNPCPCGYYPDMNKCRCTPGEVSHYLHKLSQPLLERIDLCADVPPVNFSQISEEKPGESSALIRKRVEKARKDVYKRQVLQR